MKISLSSTGGEMHVYARMFTVPLQHTNFSAPGRYTGCIASLSMHDSAHKEQICSLHLSTIDHEPARPAARLVVLPGASNLDSPTDNDACALASAVNSLLEHAADATLARCPPLRPVRRKCARFRSVVNQLRRLSSVKMCVRARALRFRRLLSATRSYLG